mmetsp:Transcript_100322/g.198962  ORF Transcript_100322/g.198962 Transcript_100322/m.198962 type:complete len:525 (-) Transcript_100322:116-1690(-)
MTQPPLSAENHQCSKRLCRCPLFWAILLAFPLLSAGEPTCQLSNGNSLLQKGMQRTSAASSFYEPNSKDSNTTDTDKDKAADRRTPEQLRRQQEVKDILDKQQDVYDRLESKEPHPFWQFNFGKDVVQGWARLVLCSLLLFLSGGLCASAGIGGNIIQVTVLMSGGGLTTTDAVPLSKVVILLGALGSLLVHSSNRRPGAAAGPAICWDTIRVAVPACLLGTFLGVRLNSRIPDSLLIFLLTAFLFCIATGVIKRATTLYYEEEAAANSRGDGPRRPTDTSESRPLIEPGTGGKQHSSYSSRPASILALLVLLLLVVCCGIVRELTEKCHDASFYLGWHAEQKHCKNPVLKIAIWGEVQGDWFEERPAGTTLICTVVPVLACLAYGGFATVATRANPQMSKERIITIQLVLFGLGLLGSLTGIGGGVVLSPFFLFLGLSVQQAVATSMTCVIFISASSAMQYAITNRVRMALALIYGLINIAGSCAGAYAMYKTVRTSVIMAVIGFMVASSFIIALCRFLSFVI